MSFGLFKNNYLEIICLQIIYLIYTYKHDLTLYNLQGLICHLTQPIKLHLKVAGFTE